MHVYTCSYCLVGLRHFYVLLPNAGHVRFSLRCLTLKNNSLVTLEDIGDDDNALLCITDRSACCRHPYTGEMGPAIGDWFIPNGTRVPSTGDLWRTRGHMVVRMNRIRGGENGIYHCKIRDAMNVIQNLYIGVYTSSSGEWYVLSILAIGDYKVHISTYCTYSDRAPSHL